MEKEKTSRQGGHLLCLPLSIITGRPKEGARCRKPLVRVVAILCGGHIFLHQRICLETF